ncbi:MAG TPA: M3 family oligoendopeptidase, partial [Ktedonobacteraceae bacterium]
MFTALPTTSEIFSRQSWPEIEPWYRELAAAPLSPETLQPWLAQWSDLSTLVDETLVRFEIATTQNTEDIDVAHRKQRFLEDVHIPIQTADQQLKEQLLASNLQPEGFAIPLRNMRAETALYREANLPLLAEDKILSDAYMELCGARMVTWDGQEVPIVALYPVLEDPNRQRREDAWRTMAARQLQDREKINNIWVKMMQLRQQIAHNAGFESYREYRWQQMLRFDYTPDDCKVFHAAVEQVIVPAAREIREKHRRMLGLDSLRPWDININPRAGASPRPISDVPALLLQSLPIFQLIDPQLKAYFETMLQENLLDLEQRPAKAPGGYELPLEVTRRPFIFGQVNSISDVVPLIFHELGHAFHVFETIPLRYIHQRSEQAVPLEFAEVASTSMEFIGALYLRQAGLCTGREEVLIRAQHLESVLTIYLPYIVTGDAFQHWIYEHPEEARHPEKVDEKWAEITSRYLPDIDWSNLEDSLRSGWHDTLHYFCVPFYFIEYAFALVGALQVWRNYLHDPHTALQQYRHALSLGATRTLPELYKAAGATFNFTPEVLQDLTQLLLHTLTQLEP